jgi:hypothetical protein
VGAAAGFAGLGAGIGQAVMEGKQFPHLEELEPTPHLHPANRKVLILITMEFRMQWKLLSNEPAIQRF